MLRTQSWEPDTHDARFVTQWDDDDPDAPHVCISAVVNGEEQKDPQGAYEAVLGQNQAKNTALAQVVAALPPEMLKPVLDPDGDPTGEMVAKVKHEPRWSLDEAGKVTISVPGLDDAAVAALDATIAEATIIPHDG